MRGSCQRELVARLNLKQTPSRCCCSSVLRACAVTRACVLPRQLAELLEGGAAGGEGVVVHQVYAQEGLRWQRPSGKLRLGGVKGAEDDGGRENASVGAVLWAQRGLTAWATDDFSERSTATPPPSCTPCCTHSRICTHGQLDEAGAGGPVVDGDSVLDVGKQGRRQVLNLRHVAEDRLERGGEP